MNVVCGRFSWALHVRAVPHAHCRSSAEGRVRVLAAEERVCKGMGGWGGGRVMLCHSQSVGVGGVGVGVGGVGGVGVGIGVGAGVGAPDAMAVMLTKSVLGVLLSS